MGLSLTSHLKDSILLETSEGVIRITLTDVSAKLGKEPQASARFSVEAPLSVRIWRERRERNRGAREFVGAMPVRSAPARLATVREI